MLNEINALINKGMSIRTIAKELNITVYQLKKIMKEFGLKTLNNPRNSYDIDDIINKKFNRLTVIEFSHNDSHGKNFKCKCDCGNIITARLSSLNRGECKSCGCLQSEHASKIAKTLHNYKDKDIYLKQSKQHIGEVFGRLTIIDTVHFKGKNVKMICQCECGNTVSVVYSDLKRGRNKSCGCLNKEYVSKLGSEKGKNNFKNKHNWYFIKDGKKIYCRSGYEVIYANYLMDNNISFLYEPNCFKLEDGTRYTPDFYLINEDKYIEIKGSFKANNSNQQSKIDLFKESYNCEVYFWSDIQRICNLNLKNYNSYIKRANKMNIKAEDYLALCLYD